MSPHLAAERIHILLQETHWAAEDHAPWEADLQGAKVIHSPAVPTLRGGSSGGVAVIVPAGSQVTSSRVVLPGLVVEACVQVHGASLRLLSVYFPPGRQAQTLADLRGAGHLACASAARPTIVGGDLNAQWPAPCRGEADLVSDWASFLRDLRTLPLAYTGGSCSIDYGASQIDFLALPTSDAGSYDCAPQWTP